MFVFQQTKKMISHGIKKTCKKPTCMTVEFVAFQLVSFYKSRWGFLNRIFPGIFHYSTQRIITTERDRGRFFSAAPEREFHFHRKLSLFRKRTYEYSRARAFIIGSKTGSRDDEKRASHCMAFFFESQFSTLIHALESNRHNGLSGWW